MAMRKSTPPLINPFTPTSLFFSTQLHHSYQTKKKIYTHTQRVYLFLQIKNAFATHFLRN